jgi:solute carrier family 34 (sodium-dependent phosphate cotransporter)
MGIVGQQRARRIGLALLGILLFIGALELLKEGAAGLSFLLDTLRVENTSDALAFGWLMAYVVLSGSPVAAISLTLFSGGVISDVMSLGMITGSRLGASFVVLFVGFIYHLRGHQRVASVSIGVLAFLVTGTIYVPALALGYYLLQSNILDGVRFGAPGALDSFIDVVYGPVVGLATQYLPSWGLFLVGIAVLLVAFRTFDKALPEVDAQSSHFGNVAEFVYRPIVMFMIGAAFTSITLSVSVSLSLLVPLAAMGYIRRENIIPYIMGANITTFVDTLFASLLLSTPRAFTIVLVEIVTVATFSLIILALFYRPYQRILNGAMQRVLRDNTSLVLFVVALVLIPMTLLLL